MMNFITRFPFSISTLVSAVMVSTVTQLTTAQPSSAIDIDFSSFDKEGDAEQSLNNANLSNNALNNEDDSADSNFNFSGDPAVDEATLTNFLSGVNSGDLDDGFFSTAREGSAIQKSFSFNAGDTFSFDWRFLTNEVGSNSQNDYAFTVIDGNITRIFEADTDSSQLSSSSTAYDSEASGTFSKTFNSSQNNIDVAIGVVDIGGTTTSSGIQVSNGTVDSTTPVPFEVEGTMGLLALGGFLGYRYLKKRKQTLNQ